ncbi:TetR/AcrR family transcriptional regulator [Allonocardiopsis opalescens]|uniref:TetR family transcriptional regulator n=1 Tax=Allonocardiopsis opalescens TaxID=1144618 RepID=A0A2T0QCI5_9ACTN|nr:TetR/AcrR family transcriptional regulator [Allonocardiopsis opalescens]PRY01629.1 TetR family transcriptional regulator [Allonocardiopsis opalescens]
MRSRREEYRESTRNAIITAALRLFSERGYAHTSLSEIATAARISKGAIYHHFANKRTVFEAVLARTFRNFTEQVESRAGGGAEVRLEVWLESYLVASADPVFSRLALQEGVTALGWQRWRVLVRERLAGYAAHLLRGAVRRAPGEPAPVDPDLTVSTLVGALQELSLAIVDSPDPDRATDDARRLVGGLLTSLRLVPRPRCQHDDRPAAPAPATGPSTRQALCPPSPKEFDSTGRAPS